jgi:hypothetical protein
VAVPACQLEQAEGIKSGNGGPLNTIRKSMMLSLIFAPLAYAADAPVDQVVVEADRASLVKLAKDVQVAEQRFYARYNEINTKRKYAVRCSEEASTGTRFKQKTCTPVYESEAQAAQGRAFIQALGSGASAGSISGGAVASSGVMGVGGASGGAGIGAGSGLQTGAQATSSTGNAANIGGTTTEAFVDIETGRPDFQKNLMEVASKSPELQKLLKAHAEARQRYDEVYRRVNSPSAKAASSATETPANP